VNLYLRQNIIDAAMGRKRAHTVLAGGSVVNVFTGEICEADVAIHDGYICGIGSYAGEKTIDARGAYICPGLIDEHFHIESTLATPREVIRHALAHGNTAFVADPHEIANVLGMEGVGYMLFETENVPFGAFFSAPSCVPCAPHEQNGAAIRAYDIEKLACLPRMVALGEMMDAAGVLSGDKRTLEKIEAFANKRVDGHFTLEDTRSLNAYFASSILTNHECTSPVQAIRQLRAGAYVQARQGGAAQNAYALLKGLAEAGVPLDRVLLCTDDKHIEEIAERGLTREPLRLAVEAGIDPVRAVRMATLNAAQAYGLRELGAVAPGYLADLALFEDLTSFTPRMVLYHGQVVSRHGSLPDVLPLNCEASLRRTVRIKPLAPRDVELRAGRLARVINLVPHEILTACTQEEVPRRNGLFAPNREYAKLCVVERHRASGSVGLGIVKGFQLEGGCIATSVSHDSHNLIAVADNDADLLCALDALAAAGGGMVVAAGGEVKALLPLPVAGLMTDAPFEEIRAGTGAVKAAARSLGVPEGVEPFMTLSFLSLTAIGDIRLTASGLYDTHRQEFVPLNPLSKKTPRAAGAAE